MVLKHTTQSRKYFNQTHYRVKGKFAKRPIQREQIKYYSNNNIPEYVYNPQREEYEKMLYRAVITLNGVPIHSNASQGRPRYKSFSWAKIDYYENISILDMKKHLLQEIANHFNCKIDDLWFADSSTSVYGTAEWVDIEYPKPYRNSGSKFEGLEVGEY